MQTKYGIEDADIYNFDKTGFMMGVILPSMVEPMSWMFHYPSRAPLQGVNADGWYILPFIILQGAYHLANWYSESNLPPEWVLGATHNGWTNNETGLE
ncbi:uncharacterized protein EURHEDRAFT_548719 [Aspergillus ruber CBS 135680]|uniref:Uncharacterized protein n=1 Tax=Aspergillus ruber (strain CBS 135680) TaxID=1388766 RepID=A0A017S2K6_ASPRC|nr:uncharacterized protein EURHEDRAFT_548719 [Aspergillus ruber CBS 135680]EYE90879.1 hypothetical protein EURHEDRAFT_548719 [Aspergillus ruber CBS 135680]